MNHSPGSCARIRPQKTFGIVPIHAGISNFPNRAARSIFRPPQLLDSITHIAGTGLPFFRLPPFHQTWTHNSSSLVSVLHHFERNHSLFRILASLSSVAFSTFSCCICPSCCCKGLSGFDQSLIISRSSLLRTKRPHTHSYRDSASLTSKAQKSHSVPLANAPLGSS